ncbi:MAG: ATP-binding protein [Eubacteriales bacterium]|nr:ATP-binding protein [Eubacteriales bacterium]
MGEIFIERKDICRRLMRDVFAVKEGSFGKCYSLIGPNGVGKTTLVRHMAEEFFALNKPHTYYFSTVLEDGCTFWSFWSELILCFSEQIGEEELQASPHYNKRNAEKILSAYCFFDQYLGRIDNDKECMSRAIRFLNGLFADYTRLGIRIIISIDEFDRARTIFQDGQFFQRLFGLTIKGSAKLNLSILTISRRSVGTIAHHMQEGSDLEAAYPPQPLRGFSNEEMEEYFSMYEKELGMEPLPEHIRQEIVCLCGRNPGLLMSMYHEIELLDGKETEISRIYAEHGGFVKKAYDRMCTLMDTEFVDREKKISSMSIFIQQFIGPVYSEKISERVETLYSYGFVTKCELGEKNVFELSGMKEYRDAGKLVYEPLTPYFVDYVKDFVVPEELNTLSGLLEKTERRMRGILCEGMSEKYPDSWEEIVNRDVPKKDDYLDKLRTLAARNDAMARNLSVSKLNVLAFMDYYQIIRNHWDVMEKYFPLYSSLSALKSDMQILNTSRNTSAHLNLEVLNEAGRRGLRETCEFVLKNIETFYTPGAAPASKISGSLMAGKEKEAARESLIGKTVEMVNLELTSTGVLRGTISGTAMGAALSKKHLQEKGVRARDYVGGTVKVRIVRWDQNAGKYNAEWTASS